LPLVKSSTFLFCLYGLDIILPIIISYKASFSSFIVSKRIWKIPYLLLQPLPWRYFRDSKLVTDDLDKPDSR